MFTVTYNNSKILRKIPGYIAEHSEMDSGNFIPAFSVTGVFWSAASVIRGGNFQYFFDMKTETEQTYIRCVCRKGKRTLRMAAAIVELENM
jgi:hypothetical protein